jgi:hypothetical protein
MNGESKAGVGYITFNPPPVTPPISVNPPPTSPVPVPNGPLPTTPQQPSTIANLYAAATALAQVYKAYGSAVICNGYINQVPVGQNAILAFQNAWNAAAQAGTLWSFMKINAGPVPVSGVYDVYTSERFASYAATVNFYPESIPPPCPLIGIIRNAPIGAQNKAGPRGGVTQAIAGIKAAGLQGVGLGQIAAMTPGQFLNAGQALYSSTSNCWLSMQHDGNLVVYDIAGEPLWASNTRGSGGVRAIMQTDGNFVVYKSYTSMAPSQAVWASGTYGHPGAWITMQNDGNLVIYQNNKALWASKNSTTPNNNLFGLFGTPKGVGAPVGPIGILPLSSQLALIAASVATNAAIQTQLSGQTDPTNASVAAAVLAIRTFAPALAAAAAPVAAAITNIQGQTAIAPVAANAVTAAATITTLLAQFVTSTATAANIPQLATAVQTLVTASLQIAATYYAQGVVNDGCPSSTLDVTAFQNAYNQYSATAIAVTSVLDTPTLAAINTLIPGASSGLNCGPTTLAPLPPTSPTTPGTTTAAPAASNTTTIVVAVAAVAAVGGLLYVLAATPKP